MANQITSIPQIDYTSKDYIAIKNDLIALIPNYAPTWTSRDPADFGMTLVELFSYMGDMLSYYIDRAANEGFIATATQRDSVLQLAAMLGYQPTTSSPATVSLTFTNSTGANVTIPAKTQIATISTVGSSTPQVIFETDSVVTVNANSTATQTATQGYTVSTEPAKTSTGAPNQVYALSQSPVIKNSIVVTINGTTYTYISSLIDAGMYDPVFTTVNDANGITYVVFGDGISGRVPPPNASIAVTYRVGSGSTGNVLANTLNYFLTNAVAGVTVNNGTAAAGGAEEESTDSIRVNAPLAMRATNRAVSLKDFAYLALQVSGVSKAVADASIFNSINLYIVPFGDNGYASGTSGTTSTTFNNLSTTVASAFMDKTAPGTSLTILPPTYVPVDITVAINVLPQYKQDVVSNQALAAIRSLLSADYTFFADTVTSQYVHMVLSNIPGISYSTVTVLTRPVAISYWSRTTNVTTLYFPTSAVTNLTTGKSVTVSGVDGTVDGTYTIASTGTGTVSSTTYNTITFSNTGTNASATAVVSGKAELPIVDTVTCNVNEIPIEGAITVTPTGGIV